MVTHIPNVQNWTVTPQNGQAGYFTLMNTWLGQSTLVIASLQTAIAAQNIANNQINELAIKAENNAIIATGLANFQGAWNNSTPYLKGQSVEYPSGSKIYYTSKVDNNLNHSVTDTNYWLYNPINNKLDKDFSLLFDKPNNTIPLFIKVSPSSIKIPAGLKLTVGTESFKLATDYTLTLASNLVGSTKTAGTDYFVYAKSDSTFYISASDAITADRLIGGFHYGLVGETESPTGNKTEEWMIEQRGIWSHSCWDLKFRPSSSVRGRNFAHGMWVDIYLADEDIAIRGYSSPWKSAGVKAKIAGGTTDYGRAIPKIPLSFGGNGTLTYGKFTWFQATEIAASLKCFLLDYNKFPSLAYGVLEGVSSSTNSYETTAGAIEHYPNLTSRYLEQAVGVQWIWGADLANYPTDTVWAWKANTDGRGQIYSTDNSPTAVRLGGVRGDGVHAGSRASRWNDYVWDSGWDAGCRFACDHLELV